MAKQRQARRGSTAQHAVFVGALAEVTVDTDKQVPVIHDGSTAGGFPAQREIAVLNSGSPVVTQPRHVNFADGVSASTTGGGTLAVGLANSGATAGTYSLATVVVDAKGRITTASSGGPISSVVAFGGDVTGSGTTGSTIGLTLANSGVTPGIYSIATVTVDSKGRVTNIATGIGSGGNIILGGDATGSGPSGSTIAVTLANSGATAGTYSLATVVVDAKGRVTSAAASAIPWEAQLFFYGTFGAAEVLLRIPFSSRVVIPVNFTGSRATARLAATSNSAFALAKNGSAFATIIFGAGSATGTYSSAITTFVSGDILSITAPVSSDVTLSDVGLSLSGTRT